MLEVSSHTKNTNIVWDISDHFQQTIDRTENAEVIRDKETSIFTIKSKEIYE